jgi:hypothetical protein
LASNPTKRPTSLGQNRLTDLKRRTPGTSGTEQDGEQFRTAQYTGTEVKEPLSRPLGTG